MSVLNKLAPGQKLFVPNPKFILPQSKNPEGSL